MVNKEKNFVSAVIYVHNSEARVEKFLNTVIEVMNENFEHSEIICVNDHSDDDSVAVIKKVSEAAKSTSISILNMSFFHGLELAMNAGVNLSIGDFVFEFDNTNLDFDKAEIMKVYKKALEGFDIVCAAPDRKEKFSSHMFYRIFEKFTDISYRMTTESFRILSRRVINRISSMNKTIPYRKAVYATSGLKSYLIKYDVKGTEEHKDKLEKSYRKGLAMDSIILFTDLGYRFASAMTIFMMLISVIVILYTVIIYATANPVAGWTTTILFLSFAFFGLFGILTFVIKYLQLIIDLVFKRKHYSFESIEKLTK